MSAIGVRPRPYLVNAARAAGFDIAGSCCGELNNFCEQIFFYDPIILERDCRLSRCSLYNGEYGSGRQDIKVTFQDLTLLFHLCSPHSDHYRAGTDLADLRRGSSVPFIYKEALPLVRPAFFSGKAA
jgi:hypothetical protein